MLVTKEVARRLLNVDAKRFPDFVKQGKLKIIKSGFGGRKYYDRNQVLELAKELQKLKEL